MFVVGRGVLGTQGDLARGVVVVGVRVGVGEHVGVSMMIVALRTRQRAAGTRVNLKPVVRMAVSDRDTCGRKAHERCGEQREGAGEGLADHS